MADLLDRIREELDARRDQLRPLVDEHARLDAALHALDDAIGRAPVVAAKRAAASPKATARKPASPARRKRAPRGANREAVLGSTV